MLILQHLRLWFHTADIIFLSWACMFACAAFFQPASNLATRRHKDELSPLKGLNVNLVHMQGHVFFLFFFISSLCMLVLCSQCQWQSGMLMNQAAEGCLCGNAALLWFCVCGDGGNSVSLMSTLWLWIAHSDVSYSSQLKLLNSSSCVRMCVLSPRNMKQST